MIQNPVLPGFHPDPSICRAGEDYYLATSTFEWFPGVRIHHSRDLRNWRPIGYALDRVSQLSMNGCANSAGVWAPCLTYADGLFWLVYTNVHNHGPNVTMDTPNYLVTAKNIEGPWSEPVFLNSYGFDPSLFHDSDGRKYIVQMMMGESMTPKRFDGIILQEYDAVNSKLIGKPVKIWEGSPLGITEGPHILRKDGWYYLITAEGGTSVRHAVSICRSRSLTGPYELHPQNPMLTSLKPDTLTTYQHEPMELWTSGHGCFVDTPSGEWFCAHLCQRPLQRPGRLILQRELNKSIPLGRETAIQAFRWDDDGWPRLSHGDCYPRVQVPVNLPEHRWPAKAWVDPFSSKEAFSEQFQTLRVPLCESWASFSRKPGFLSLRGRDSLASNFDQSVVARRLTSHNAEAEVFMQFAPEHFKQMAGLITYYDRYHFHYLRVTHVEGDRAKIGVMSFAFDQFSRFEVTELPVSTVAAGIRLRMEQHGTELRFYWATASGAWNTVPRYFEGTQCGDWVSPTGGFTGTFWGVCCQDLATRSIWADFKDFRYTDSTRHSF